jgi:hypothetical protein
MQGATSINQGLQPFEPFFRTLLAILNNALWTVRPS